jgi:ATP-dependent Zn protease
MVGELGMGAPTTTASLAIGLPGADAAETTERTEKATRALLEDAFATATRILEEHHDLLHRSADALLGAEALERDDLDVLLGPRPAARRLDPTGPLPA